MGTFREHTRRRIFYRPGSHVRSSGTKRAFWSLSFLARSYVHTPSSQALTNSSITGSMYTPISLPRCPEIINDKNMFYLWKHTPGGRLRGIMNTDQHVHGEPSIHKDWTHLLLAQHVHSSPICFLMMNAIKVGPCFTIRWMYQFVSIVSFPLFVPCHMFRGFLGHV
jgi:hypothetical protein